MLEGERIIAVIPARGGSKSVPGKNLAPLGGKPLIVWSIEVARSVDLIDRIVVSTDDDAIAEVAQLHGAEVYERPAHLATDSSLVVDALRDLIARLGAEGETSRVMILLEPTCPFRSGDDVRVCIEGLVRGKMDSVATFKKADLNPCRAWRIVDGRPSTFIADANPWQPRQKLPEAYQLNGAVYVFRTDRLPLDSAALLYGRTRAVIMPAERSIDIDTRFDLVVAETLLEQGRD